MSLSSIPSKLSTMVTQASQSEEAEWQCFEIKEFSGSFAVFLNLSSLNNKARGKS